LHRARHPGAAARRHRRPGGPGDARSAVARGAVLPHGQRGVAAPARGLRPVARKPARAMPDVSFNGLLVVSLIAFLCPLLVGLFPRVLRVPAVVLEIVAGIIVGPSGLGWVEIDLPIQILALIGLAFLLFLAGLEIDLARLRVRLLRLAAMGFGLTMALGLIIGLV